ncbi:hypothetical protein [Kangiella sp. HZ709]|uniref:hypothetical protein n=1 Tax=Kangiella sp. HZ709 TaxID=2666328 RepID=UPI0012AFF757|nr:hypothetical protein [Kangiella sp. HZ709]MRX27035.1 hypothetical protein [Kangiella sp. HZ709]
MTKCIIILSLVFGTLSVEAVERQIGKEDPRVRDGAQSGWHMQQERRADRLDREGRHERAKETREWSEKMRNRFGKSAPNVGAVKWRR